MAGYQEMLQAWIAAHGFVSLEVFGNLDWLSGTAREDLFSQQLDLLTSLVGLGA